MFWKVTEFALRGQLWFAGWTHAAIYFWNLWLGLGLWCGGGGSAGMLHSSQFDQVSFSLVLYVEVTFLMSFLEIVVDNFGLRCSFEDKEIMCVTLRKVFLDSLKAGGPFPITLMFRIRFFTFLSMCCQLFQSRRKVASILVRDQHVLCRRKDRDRQLRIG